MDWQDMTAVKRPSRWIGLIAIGAVLVGCAVLLVASYASGGWLVSLSAAKKVLSEAAYTAVPMIGVLLVASESLSWGGSSRIRPRHSRSPRVTKTLMTKAAVKKVVTAMRSGSSHSVGRLPENVFSLAGGAFLLLVLVGILQNMGARTTQPSWLTGVVEELAHVANLEITALGSALLGLGIVLVIVTRVPARWRGMTALSGIAFLGVSLGSYALRLASTAGSVWPGWAMQLSSSFEMVTMLTGCVLFATLIVAQPLLRLSGVSPSSL
ncbi:MAG: hypothetical protein FWF25_04835 [Propionibacteriaceae bacterium]|nr:hypothetical protein [Propionibacteriaceae bacterium]